MTMTQQILAAHSGQENVEPGQLIEADLDLVLGNDITAPVAIREMARHGLDSVFDRDKIALVLDHFTPNKDIQSAAQCAGVRDFAKKHGIANFFDVGDMGIEHALIPERGLAAPGELILGADSHTCTYGALGAFSTGSGSTDMAAGMATGKIWLRIPDAIKVELSGSPRKYVTGKDIILTLIGILGVDGARYSSLEFFGAEALSMDDRFTIANMAIECGAKNGIFQVDEKTLGYIKDRVSRKYNVYKPGPDAEYARTVRIDLGGLSPVVALPPSPGNVRRVRDAGVISVNQVVIGSCTNGRLEDLKLAAELMRGRRVAKGVRCIIIPATQRIYLDALRLGLIEAFIEAGAAVSTPTCGPCLGGHMGILADGERCAATTNRNFQGRMGHAKSEVYLVSPAVAAATAIAGELTDPSGVTQ